MDDRHFRAVIRANLRAAGFDVQVSELAAAEHRMRVLGLRLRELLVERLPGFAVRADILRLAQEDSHVWNQLPSMLAFGHQQGVVFGRLIHPERRALPAASLLPVAAFSAGISLLDYLADALGLAEPIFGVLDQATVASLFSSSREAEARLRHDYEQAGDLRLRLLFALAAFAALHGAQKAVTFHHGGPVADPGEAGPVVTKSVLPFVAAYQIVELMDPPGAAKRSGRDLARQLGQAVALTDDLVDWQADWRSGTPNTLVASVGADDRGPDGGLTDAWLYRVAGQAGRQIVATLKSAALLYPPGRPAGTRLTAIEAAARFATFTVARWVGWHEELSPPSVFSYRRPRPARALLEPCAGAVSILLQQQRTGYQEAVHWMTVPRLDGDRVRLETHPAIVFQRAVALDGLLDAYVAALDLPVSVLAHEALLVLQVLSRCGGQPLAATCDQALDLALAAADRGEAVSTWILDPEQAPHRNQVFRRYIELTQADGVHPDVVANLLYAVSLQPTETGRKRATSAIAYLESAQGDDGSWRSRWYWGKHYGTYRAVLALTALTPASRALSRARDHLVSGQHADGGWGADGQSDPLSTAFAALAGRPRSPRHRSPSPLRSGVSAGHPATRRRLARLPLHRFPSMPAISSRHAPDWS